MITLLIYDIPDDKLRGKVADVCLDYGLHRIQFSSFLGEMSRNRQGEIVQKIRRLVGRHEANVQIFPLCEKDLALRREVVVKPQEAN
ncbi:MAG: CRISPR-associated endonuclease Cas2 [Chloroflexi bacterium]|nr:CRISPR-associated endonuclease Cas2 [Chloroflexota bacterium]